MTFLYRAVSLAVPSIATGSTSYRGEGRTQHSGVGHLTAGSYRRTEKAIDWDSQTGTGEQVGSGTYFYQLQAGNYTETRKMVILK